MIPFDTQQETITQWAAWQPNTFLAGMYVSIGTIYIYINKWLSVYDPYIYINDY